MATNLHVGKRLNYLRKRANFSQLDLETAIDASSGSISRIENGKVNPTKETLHAISKCLELTTTEHAYLLGLVSPLPSEKEITAAIQSVKAYFASSHKFAYLIDDRARFIYVSAGFKRIFKLSEQDVKRLCGTHIFEMMLNPELPVRQYLDEAKFDEFFRLQAARQASTLQLHKHEDWYLELFARLQTYPGFKAEYLDVDPDPSSYLEPEARSIWFDFNGIKVKTIYTREVLKEHPRFTVIEHMVANPIVNKLVQVFT